jgi:hypothetical protein
LLTRTDEYEPLWRDEWARVESALESFKAGRSRVVEDAESGLSVVTLTRDLYGPSGFKPTRHAAPFTAIAHNARGRLFLVATPLEDGWSYRVDYPYYSWAVTIVRPRITRADHGAFVEQMNELEGGGTGTWKADRSELTSAVKFLGAGGTLAVSRLEPDAVASELRAALTKQSAAKLG